MSVNRIMYPGIDNQEKIVLLNKHISYPDWLFLQSLGKGMDPLNFKRLLNQLIDKCETMDFDSDAED